MNNKIHRSDCAIHNGPATPPGPCDCEPLDGPIIVLTCAYCGKEYPIGTPSAKAEALNEHIKICPKHPVPKLRKALADLIGASTKEDLEAMEAVLRLTPGVEQDKVFALNAIHILIETI